MLQFPWMDQLDGSAKNVSLQSWSFVKEVEPNAKNKEAYEEAFKRHDELSKGFFEGKGVAYV